MEKLKIIFFQKSLIKWYSIKGRKFPWRNKSATNYEKIIAEILLQRTLASTVARFFPLFIKKYPSWKQLAKATERELKETFKPIGLYNQKATGLFKLAQKVIKNNSKLPKDHEEIKQLPLFGEYITNAYELIILNKNIPLLDGNMKRVLKRFFYTEEKISPKDLKVLSYEIVDIDKSLNLNWAILDFAALVCKIKNPDCNNCIINKECNYFKINTPIS